MPLPVLLYVVVTSLYAGFQWTVQVVVYRQFAEVPAGAFPQYEGLHQRRITYLVGPLFGALVLSTGWLGLDRPPTVPGWAPVAAAALLAVVLGATAFLAVPQHRRLGVAVAARRSDEGGRGNGWAGTGGRSRGRSIRVEAGQRESRTRNASGNHAAPAMRCSARTITMASRDWERGCS